MEDVVVDLLHFLSLSLSPLCLTFSLYLCDFLVSSGRRASRPLKALPPYACAGRKPVLVLFHRVGPTNPPAHQQGTNNKTSIIQADDEESHGMAWHGSAAPHRPAGSTHLPGRGRALQHEREFVPSPPCPSVSRRLRRGS